MNIPITGAITGIIVTTTTTFANPFGASFLVKTLKLSTRRVAGGVTSTTAAMS
ncbi:MAG TPA: hypothetical protein VN684_11900 [Terriglobales bacterium]|nr:hypothetical protein [Terriglobales bacterium]